MGSTALPADDLAGYLTTYANEMAFSDDPPEQIIDRYHVPEVVWNNDGMTLTRESLIAHVKPVRKNVTECTVRVDHALIVGRQVAARYTMTAGFRTGATIATEIFMFGEVDPDGRLSRIEQVTRKLPVQ